jgi:hypothetical protein
MDEIVAIAIIEGEYRKGPLGRLVVYNPGGRLVEVNQIETTIFDQRYHFVEKLRCNFKTIVWGKTPVQTAAGPDMMQHKDCTASAEDAAERLGCTRIVQHI